MVSVYKHCKLLVSLVLFSVNTVTEGENDNIIILFLPRTNSSSKIGNAGLPGLGYL
jgi:hypothetical protein